MNFTLISKGTRKAEIVIRHAGGGSLTRHLLLTPKGWTDAEGTVYDIGE